MNADVKDRWVVALRSRAYQQGVGNLRDLDDHYCCLGVLCALAVKDGVISVWMETQRYIYGTPDWPAGASPSLLPSGVVAWAGLVAPDGSPDVKNVSGEAVSLSSLNDMGVSFAAIADLIERDL